ncbi:hypothetical protein [Nocardioides coralli]|uniref:hypothetical protein n=1 Tax=Nocardioides coralli TaxID=2872154 RepID=UPI001CA3F7DF|nr:hypothetical protein [Nocardioides coralli]QZY27966.1 hypothetical protein K6T13_10700 [Nocardioides coralli]
MSITPAAGVGATDLSAPAPRVRHQARDVLVLMVFSATVSASLACCLVLLTSLGRQG